MKIKSFDFGEDAEFNIDKLIEAIKAAVVEGNKNEHQLFIALVRIASAILGSGFKIWQTRLSPFPDKVRE